MKKLICMFVSAMVMLSLAIPAFAEEIEPESSCNTRFEISSPTFPDAYIITETLPLTRGGDDNSGSLGSISATVFVEEMYDVVNGELIVTNSRLLSKDEVMAIGVENFDSLNRPSTQERAASSSRGKLTITFSGNYNTSNGVSCSLTGSAKWDNSGFHTEGENFCATGEDFIGVTWAGEHTVKSSSISGTNHLGGAITINNAESTPNVGRVWSFNDVVKGSKYNIYAKDINLQMTISKNTLTGNGNTAEAVLKYIHTYSKVNGSISISASASGVAGSFSLSNTDKQWSIVCTVTGIPY